MSQIAVIYARYSSDMQRDASIEAQIRSCTEYAERRGYHVSEVYADRALSGKSAKKRSEFQRMIADAKNRLFDVLIVDKIDRFARSIADVANYIPILSDNKVELLSVHENIDSTPQGRMTLGIFSTLSEFYSANLALEVQKGMKENAYKCIHTGGVPPLGFDIDPTTKRLVINDYEAGAVRLIFRRTIEGDSYNDIASELRNLGYTTKRDNAFGYMSFNSILTNEKYVGVYVFNKSAKATSDGKRNGHKYKDESEIIRIENGCPAIVSREDFDAVQKIMRSRKQRGGAFTAKQTYLLSGKIFCGECGGSFCGNSKRPRPDHPLQIEYRCNKLGGKVSCTNKCISRDLIEGIVLKELSERLFDDSLLDRVVAEYSAYCKNEKNEAAIRQQGIKQNLLEVESDINKVVDLMIQLQSPSLGDRLHKLEARKAELETALKRSYAQSQGGEKNAGSIKKAFQYAKQQMKEGGLKNVKQIVAQYIDRIIVSKEYVDIFFNLGYFNSDSTTKKNQTCTHQCLSSDSSSYVTCGERFATVPPQGYNNSKGRSKKSRLHF